MNPCVDIKNSNACECETDIPESETQCVGWCRSVGRRCKRSSGKYSSRLTTFACQDHFEDIPYGVVSTFGTDNHSGAWGYRIYPDRGSGWMKLEFKQSPEDTKHITFVIDSTKFTGYSSGGSVFSIVQHVESKNMVTFTSIQNKGVKITIRCNDTDMFVHTFLGINWSHFSTNFYMWYFKILDKTTPHDVIFSNSTVELYADKKFYINPRDTSTNKHSITFKPTMNDSKDITRLEVTSVVHDGFVYSDGGFNMYIGKIIDKNDRGLECIKTLAKLGHVCGVISHRCIPLVDEVAQTMLASGSKRRRPPTRESQRKKPQHQKTKNSPWRQSKHSSTYMGENHYLLLMPKMDGVLDGPVFVSYMASLAPTRQKAILKQIMTHLVKQLTCLNVNGLFYWDITPANVSFRLMANEQIDVGLSNLGTCQVREIRTRAVPSRADADEMSDNEQFDFNFQDSLSKILVYLYESYVSLHNRSLNHMGHKTVTLEFANRLQEDLGVDMYNLLLIPDSEILHTPIQDMNVELQDTTVGEISDEDSKAQVEYENISDSPDEELPVTPVGRNT